MTNIARRICQIKPCIGVPIGGNLSTKKVSLEILCHRPFKILLRIPAWPFSGFRYSVAELHLAGEHMLYTPLKEQITTPRKLLVPRSIPVCTRSSRVQPTLWIHSGQFRDQKSFELLKKPLKKPHYMFSPRKKVTSRTFRISGTLIVINSQYNILYVKPIPIPENNKVQNKNLHKYSPPI